VDNPGTPPGYPQRGAELTHRIGGALHTSAVRIDVSVATDGGQWDVGVTGPASASLADVSAAVRDAVGIPGAPLLWVGGRALDDGCLGDGVLRTGAAVDLHPPQARAARLGILSLHVVGGPDAGRVVAVERGRLTIGRDPSCDLVLADPDVSRRHAELQVAAGISVRDLGSTNGTYLDGAALDDAAVPLRTGAVVRMGDSLLTLAGPTETPASVQEGADGTRQLLRPPRGEAPGTADREIALPVPAEHARPRGVQWLSALFPAGAGVALAWYAGSPQFLLFALLSPVMIVSTALGDRLHWRRSQRHDARSFRRRRGDADRQVAAGLAAEACARRRVNPDPATVARIAALPSSRLWARSVGDADFLELRVGCGDVPARLAVREGTERRPAGVLTDVPVTVDLRSGPLGLAGPPDVVDAVAAWLVGQIAVHHSPAELEFAFLLSAERAGAWSWVRWLPHVRGRVAASAEQQQSLVAQLAALVDQRRAAHLTGPRGWAGPWLVVVADRTADVADIPGLGGLLAVGAAAGITAVCVEQDAGRLPAACRTLVRVHGETGTRLAVPAAPGEPAMVVVADRVAPGWTERLARDLAPLVDAAGERGGTAPAQCGLWEVLALPDAPVDAITERWADSDGGARAVLGAGPDGPLVVDLAREGPHVLVAGTTGSGKSELLQTLVATLAANHPPDKMNFLLVDYKGGAAFAECDGLPHSAGLVTDLDPYLTERALRSLDSELRRRERLLATVGAIDLERYRAAHGGNPLPRLVIVVDEFAALAEELPDFVRGLIGVAQRGRSLGVHLVLATQRPGSAVSPEIRANTALRICLRVTDPGESSDVVGTADAALLHRSTPGRAFLRSGAQLTCFQSAYASGASSRDADVVAVQLLGPWRLMPAPPARPGDSDLARLVGALQDAAHRSGRRRAITAWLPPLPEQLSRAELGQSPDARTVRMARIDLPDEQRQAALDLNLAAGESMLIIGTGRSGRTEALASIALGAAAQLAPTELAVHVVDPGGRLRDITRPLPHLATALGNDDGSLVPRLLTLLERQCTGRDGPTAGESATAGPTTSLLLIDGWDRLLATLPDSEAAACTDRLAQLLRVGPSAGLNVVVAGDRSALVPRFSAGFRTKVLLRQAERSDFGLAGIPARAVPAELPPGRGLRSEDGAVLQIAHAGLVPGGSAAAAESVAAQWSTRGAGPSGRRRLVLAPLPGRVRLSELACPPGALAIGLAGDRLDCLAIDPFSGSGRVLVAGPPRSGRSTVLCSLAHQAARAGIRTVVAAPGRSRLVETARTLRLPVIEPGAADTGPRPAEPTLVLVDDCEAFADTDAGDRLSGWLRTGDGVLAAVVAGRSDDLATSYRGLGADMRRSHCGILLRPGPVDGELLGVRLPRRPSSGPPGRGVAVGDPAWGPLFEAGEPVPVQVAIP
jgi:S-DNA-T family DNA segregation ATPase FtsK/SpoIIIE